MLDDLIELASASNDLLTASGVFAEVVADMMLALASHTPDRPEIRACIRDVGQAHDRLTEARKKYLDVLQAVTERSL